MATLNELLLVQTLLLQLLDADQGQPTVREVAEAAEDGSAIAFLIEKGKAVGVDVSLYETLLAPESDLGKSVDATLASAANAIDTDRKYGFPYDSQRGYLAVAWWIVDQTPPAARAVNLGF